MSTARLTVWATGMGQGFMNAAEKLLDSLHFGSGQVGGVTVSFDVDCSLCVPRHALIKDLAHHKHYYYHY